MNADVSLIRRIKLLILKLGLYAEIDGSADIKWQEHSTTSYGSSHAHTVYFYGREDYLTLECHLKGNEGDLSLSFMWLADQTSILIEMLPGSYSFSFTFALNRILPSSVRETFGKVEYFVTVIFERQFKFDLKFPFEFTVTRPLDLNLFPNLEISVEQEIIENFCYMICGQKSVIFTASLSKSGFVPGDNFKVLVNLDNQTNIKIQHVLVSLVKYIEYRSQRPHQKTRHEEFCEHQEVWRASQEWISFI